MLYVSGTDADEVCSLNKLKESSFQEHLISLIL